ncbi:serine aminopeptidase domain-containing protein [Variovorax sp. PAMC 28711]|uniref:serine aminopeptidase domain-containing protein n=1 Tax=Variovorax sp. PAMC 28711 TaxID=1795631 RepID=UPI00078EB0C0|nr:alpha/beta hydrolase [Variovorax sp. PAMC 28711]AMM24061.1 hypothetical protein AX767_06665 [Variovorax sp. PAMC 28711]
MKPIIFGPPERRLVGLFHPAEKVNAQRAAVLMCYPFGHEATRIHRLYRVLAERLCRQGIAVLRFDFHGAGDSPGADTDGEMSGWEQDILQAHGELVRMTSAACVSWFASRLGATLALRSAGAARELKRLVLWDPIVDGATYVKELRVTQAATLDLAFYARSPSWYVAKPELATSPLTESMGFGISAELADQIARLRSSDLAVPASVPATVFASPDDTNVAGWCKAQSAGVRRVALETLVHPIVWTSDPLANSAIVPSEVIRRLSTLLHETV